MLRFSPSALRHALDEALTTHGVSADAGLCVAYSGGLDSTVLLHALARLSAGAADRRVRAVHVDHRLQAQSTEWARRCCVTARSLGVELLQVQVEVARHAGDGLEAAAREARYAALRAALYPGEVLLTAHHADDQLETLLLALLRGAGVRGLSAIPHVQPFGPGWLVRPLLAFPRGELAAWAQRERLEWVHDPSNENTGFDRNYLRHRVLPVLRERWPAAALSAARSAAHLHEGQRVLDAIAASDAAGASAGACLRVASLRALDPMRRRNVLREWIRRHGVRAPSARKLASIEHDMLNARADRVPCAALEGAELRRHGGLLYLLAALPALSGPDLAFDREWLAHRRLELPAGLGRLRLVPAHAASARARHTIAAEKLTWPLRVRFRAGGESLRPSGDAHHRKLKKLLQSARVLPWWRGRVPLIYSGERLVAVGDLWVAHEFAARDDAPSLRVVWEDAPAWQAAESAPDATPEAAPEPAAHSTPEPAPDPAPEPTPQAAPSPDHNDRGQPPKATRGPG
jgi:tRNA(Ile)-lysidine synthase